MHPHLRVQNAFPRCSAPATATSIACWPSHRAEDGAVTVDRASRPACGGWCHPARQIPFQFVSNYSIFGGKPLGGSLCSTRQRGEKRARTGCSDWLIGEGHNFLVAQAIRHGVRPTNGNLIGRVSPAREVVDERTYKSILEMRAGWVFPLKILPRVVWVRKCTEQPRFER